MSRKTETVIIEAEGRDKGKAFFITEFPPRKSDAWAVRALTAIAQSGKDALDDETVQAIRDTGMPALAALGLRAITSIRYDDAMVLLDELLEAVSFVPDTSKTVKDTGQPFMRPLNDDDIEEVVTLSVLRDKVFEVHTGFSIAATLSKLGSAAQATLNRPDTPTSPESSAT